MIQVGILKGFDDYELIDSGGQEKLERFGKYTLIRPEPQALWKPSLSENEWQKLANARFRQEGSSSGSWEMLGGKMPEQWEISYSRGKMNLKFRLALTGFKHVGIFPEQAHNWNFIYDQSKKNPGAKVLNLFAYTGGASLAARAAGADVIHCDSIRQVVNWANSNMELSGLDNIRWLIEDAFKFVKREAGRGRKYNGIILDPPAWGHGPKGEKWKLEDQVQELIAHVAEILEPKKSFLVFNAYSLGYSPLILRNLVLSNFEKEMTSRLECGELALPESGGRLLPAGVFARFGV